MTAHYMNAVRWIEKELKKREGTMFRLRKGKSDKCLKVKIASIDELKGSKFKKYLK